MCLKNTPCTKRILNQGSWKMCTILKIAHLGIIKQLQVSHIMDFPVNLQQFHPRTVQLIHSSLTVNNCLCHGFWVRSHGLQDDPVGYSYLYGHHRIIQVKEEFRLLRRKLGFHVITPLLPQDTPRWDIAALSNPSCTTNSSRRANGLGIPHPERKSIHYIFFF